MSQAVLTKKDFASDQTVRWCPGCGDYGILTAVQKTMPELGIAKENIAFVSGIGCSSRFPYYMNTYGFHTIHGRAPAIASGLKLTRPDLSVWMVTGDGDALSIGGNHLIHILRRNLDINILLFNNEIYGLTKGQYSPTSAKGTVAKSTPDGSVDTPFSPLRLAIGAGGSFMARTFDKDMKHMEKTVKAAHQHKGTSFVEVLQNCVIFNDEVFEPVVGKENRHDTMIFVEHGQKMLFGKDNSKGLRLNHGTFDVISAVDNPDQVAVYDESDPHFLQTFEAVGGKNGIPVPFGVLYRENRSTYEDDVEAQVQSVIAKKGKGDLRKLLHAAETWEVR
ncbi:MAG: 2-oxoacid:ferredoxin oxidoreductase subunit beta [Leptospiraceae bacterium]|nr:2-oxoacid:ferredoxin oxidoreductase subunit beta [Leptospiraceae bacterium]